jgi:FkbM family methyltransferase
MSLQRRVWQRLPTGLRDRLRVALYNRRCAPARFSLRDGVYRASVQGEELRTWDHPFELAEGLRRYLLRQTPAAGQVIVDAGAFHGLYTLWFAARVGPEGRVVAVEPDAENRIGLRRNLALNPGLRVDVVEEPLWNAAVEVGFFPQGNVASSFFWSPAGQAAEPRRTTTLDAIVEKLSLPRLDFVKMDVEGAEVHALRGAEESIRRFQPGFAIASYHHVYGGPTFPIVEAFFRDAGYQCETVWHGRECMTYGWPG